MTRLLVTLKERAYCKVIVPFNLAPRTVWYGGCIRGLSSNWQFTAIIKEKEDGVRSTTSS